MENNQFTQVLGIVGQVPKGEYDNDTFYEYLNIVTYNKSSYIALQKTQGNLPTNTDYWQLLSHNGTIIERMEIVNGDLLVTYNE